MKLEVTGNLVVDTPNGRTIIDGSELDFELEESYENSSGTENVVKATYDGDGFTVIVTMHEYPSLVINQQYVEVENGSLIDDNLSFSFVEDEDF